MIVNKMFVSLGRFVSVPWCCLDLLKSGGHVFVSLFKCLTCIIEVICLGLAGALFELQVLALLLVQYSVI